MLNEYSFDNIYIRHAIDDSPDDKDFTMHIHEQCEIYFFISGSVEYLVEGSEYPLEENSLMIMRPAESHKARITESRRYERYAVNFPLTLVEEIDPEGVLVKAFTSRSLGKNNMFSSSEMDMQLVHRLFIEMCSEDCDYNRRVTIKTHLFILLDMINRAFLNQDDAEYKTTGVAGRIISYINNHLCDDISVPVIAKHFYLSPSQLSRIFRRSTGAAPWEYITKKRLTAAKEKINHGFSAQEASESCGFKDYSSFYRAYRKYFGCSPKEGRDSRNYI